MEIEKYMTNSESIARKYLNKFAVAEEEQFEVQIVNLFDSVSYEKLAMYLEKDFSELYSPALAYIEMVDLQIQTIINERLANEERSSSPRFHFIWAIDKLDKTNIQSDIKAIFQRNVQQFKLESALLS